MTRFPGRLRVAACILGLSLVAASSTAASELPGPPQSRASQLTLTAESPRGVLAGLWKFLSSLWSKNGGSPDPDGSHGSQPPVPGSTSDNGGSPDPNG